MPGTPEIIVDAFVANNTARAAQPKIVSLTDGTLLAAYSTIDANGKILLRGQVFDADGTPLGRELRFIFGIGEELADRSFDLVASENNTVILAFRADESGSQDVMHGIFSVSPGLAFVRLRSSDSDTQTDLRSPVVADVDGTSDYRTYTVAKNFGVSQVRESGVQGGDVPDQGRLGLVERFRGNKDVELDATTLENGNVVFIIDRDGATGNDGNIFFKVRTPDGKDGPEGETGNPNEITHDPFITALRGGGFVVAWAGNDGTDTDVQFQIFDGNGTARTPVRQFGDAANGPDADFNHEPAIVPLEDGGFIIFYDQDLGGNQVRGQRFDTDGRPVGDNFLVASENAGEIDATVMPDGRVAVIYAVESTGLVKTVILDGTPGEIIIGGTGGADDLAGTNTAEIIVGFGGDDSIAGGGGSDAIDGGAGNDIIDGGGGNDALEGGGGNDSIDGSFGNDVLNGGAGNDILTGGGGRDDFVFVGSFGDDRISDFDAQNNAEDIDLSGVEGVDSFEDVANASRQQGDDVVIEIAGGSITLENVNLADLDANDFLF